MPFSTAKRLLAGLAIAGALAAPAWSALPVGAVAPTFSVQATQGGHVTPFNLADMAITAGVLIIVAALGIGAGLAFSPSHSPAIKAHQNAASPSPIPDPVATAELKTWWETSGNS